MIYPGLGVNVSVLSRNIEELANTMARGLELTHLVNLKVGERTVDEVSQTLTLTLNITLNLN